jgi:ActR/RegA family two-component response regulator
MLSDEQSPAQTILIVDDDLGFVMWLGHTLAAAGYMTLPVTSAEATLRVMAELEVAVIDLAIVNPATLGMSHLIDTLRSRQGYLRVIATEPSRHRAIDLDAAEGDWIAKVRRVLERARTAD